MSDLSGEEERREEREREKERERERETRDERPLDETCDECTGENNIARGSHTRSACGPPGATVGSAPHDEDK